MKSKYKNSTQDDILNRLIELKDEQFPFHQPVLQRDTFWIYCRARKYWGTYKNALNEANIVFEDDGIKSEVGYKIDWWQFRESQNQREWLAIALKYLYDNYVDISPRGLKSSPYFDIYTDAVNLFGRYDVALEYAKVSKDMPNHIGYPDNESVFSTIIEMYCCDSHEQRCKFLKNIDTSVEKNVETLDRNITECPVIVDGANVAYVRKKPSLDHVKLVDSYLQEIGFARSNITFIFDASFRYKVNIDDFDKLINEDERYSLAPPGEQADAHILTQANELLKQNLNVLIITNDQYKQYFEEHPELEGLKSRKRGVTWIFILKKPKPVINLLGL